MRELTARIQFTTACLGSVKRYWRDPETNTKWPVYYMPRIKGSSGKIRFEASWWRSSLGYAAEVMCKHQKAAKSVDFDIIIDGKPNPNEEEFFRRHLKDGHAARFIRHEAFMPGEIIGVNFIVPGAISDADFWTLMDNVGRFKGVSPYGRSKGYGRFQVERIRSRETGDDLQRGPRAADQTGKPHSGEGAA